MLYSSCDYEKRTKKKKKQLFCHLSLVVPQTCLKWPSAAGPLDTRICWRDNINTRHFFECSQRYNYSFNQRLFFFKASALWADAFYKSICQYVCVCVCVFTSEVPFTGPFAPTSWNWMSNIFRYSESLGKSNGKKWSHIWTFFFGSGLKSPRKKKFVFLLILPYKTWWKPRFPMD